MVIFHRYVNVYQRVIWMYMGYSPSIIRSSQTGLPMNSDEFQMKFVHEDLGCALHSMTPSHAMARGGCSPSKGVLLFLRVQHL